MSDDHLDRREYFRYNPDDNALAEIRRDDHDDVVGLVRDESYTGCAAVYQKTAFDLDEGESVVLKVGHDTAREAEVKWIEDLDEQLLKVGFEWED